MSDVIIKKRSQYGMTMYHIEIIGQTTKRHIIHKWIENNIPSYRRISHNVYWFKDEEYVVALKLMWNIE